MESVITKTLNAGDIVKLLVPVDVSEIIDEDKNKHWIVEQMPEKKAKKISPPWILFGTATGICLGKTRLKVKDPRATRGVIRRFYYRFMFGTHEVNIEHHLVDVFISYKELVDEASKRED